MKAAIYARYSSDKQRESSITDQQRNCIKYIEREGWEARKPFYYDEGISGTTDQRPGYQSMLADAKNRKFDILVVDDLSRLSRDDIETKQTIRRFKFWRVRLISVSDGYDSTAKGSKMHAAMRGMMNDIFIDDLSEKTHRGMAGKALSGFNTGGPCYGYRNIPIYDPRKQDQYGRAAIMAVKREIDPKQAKVVKRIFEMYANGSSPKQIAAALNEDRIPSPRKGTWAASAIYGDMRFDTGLLNQSRYIGLMRWNRGRWLKDPDNPKHRVLEAKPKSEWIVKQMPELRIVPQALWDKVKRRQQQQASASHAIRTRLHTKARTGAGPKYLFSSLLKCGQCGANYIMTGPAVYGCAANLHRGDAVCDNRTRVSRHLVEDKLLAAIKADLFTEQNLAHFKAAVRRLMAERRAGDRADTTELKRELTRAEKELGNLMTAIKAGLLTPTTKAELNKLEGEKARLERQLNPQGPAIDNVEELLPRLAERYRELVKELPETVGREMSRARNLIRALVGGQIKIVPAGKGGLHAIVQGDYAGLRTLIAENGGPRANKSGAGYPI